MSAPSKPTEGVTASGVETEGQRAVRKVRLWIKCGMPDQSDNTPSLTALRRDLETVLSLAENSPSSALGGDAGPQGRSEPKDHPTPVGGLEPAAWRARIRPDGAWLRLEQDYVSLRADDPAIEVEPLYSSSTVSTLQAEIERLRARLKLWEPQASCPPSVSSALGKHHD